MINNNIRLIVGLGNMEDKYLQDRHNIGFMAIDHIAQQLNIIKWQHKFQGKFTVVTNPDQSNSDIKKIILLKPSCYMNLSGLSVQALASYYKIDIDNIVVIHDELDLASGQMKVKLGGGTAGHNGLKSISQALGSNYWRIRIGIGHPGHKSLVAGYVLSKPTNQEQHLIDQKLTLLSQQLNIICSNNLHALHT